MNERIRAREVRVIGPDGEQLGIMTPQDATRKAREQNFDLVEISPTAVPPVCRIMDYGKFLYEQEKKERAAKKNQKQIVLKEVKFSVNVDEHDYVTKRNQNLGRKVLERLMNEVGDKAVIEFRPRMEGNTVHVIMAPPRQVPGGGGGGGGSKKPEKPQQEKPQPQAAAGGQTQGSK
jgi:translation initiation factor IF-3